MKLLREYIRVLLEQEKGSKGSLVVVDIQPEYESNASFDIGDMLRTAAEDYSRVLFLFNGEDTLGMVSESALKDFYFEKLDYDEEALSSLLSKSTFFDKGYGFFRDVMDSGVCFDRTSIVKIVKHMIDNDIRDIRELEEEDVEAIGISELLFDELEDYGFWVPELEDILPNWSGSDLAGGARNECMAEVEILGAAQGLSFNQVDQFIYEGDTRYTEEVLTETLNEQNVLAQGMCFPFAYQKAEEWFEDHFTPGGRGRAVKRHPDLNDKSKFKVVHGTVTDKWKKPPKPVVHGWVEMGDLVFDDQTQHTKPNGVEKEFYYDTYQPEIKKEFTAEDALINCVKYGGEGPWDEELYAQMQQRDAWLHEDRAGREQLAQDLYNTGHRKEKWIDDYHTRGLLAEYGRAHTAGKKNVYRGMKIEMPAGIASMVRTYMKTGQTRGMSRGELVRFVLAQCQNEHCGESWSLSFDIAVNFSKSWEAKNNRGKTLYIVLQATVDEDAGYDPQAAGEEPGMFYDEQEVRFKPGGEIPLTGLYVFRKSKNEWEKQKNQFHTFMARGEDDPMMVKA